MKTFIFSALALGMMASCSNTEVEGIDAVDNGEPVAIQLSAGVETNVVAGVTRAAITGKDGVFVATVLGWEKTGDADYATNRTWLTTTNNISAQANGEAITLQEIEYYSSNKEVSTYMKAYYPAGTAENGVYTFTTPEQDGTQDVLVSGEVKGSRIDAATKSFVFTHPLTQLQFSVKAGETWKGGSVKSIALKSIKLATGVNIADNSLVSKDVVSLSITGIDAAGVEVKTAAAKVGAPTMILPITGKTISIDVEMMDGTSFENITVTTEDESFIAGKAYAIELTFKNKKIDGTATVQDWTDGGKTTGDVE